MSLGRDKRSLFSSASDRLSAGCHRVRGSLWKLASAHWSFLTAFWKQCGETRYPWHILYVLRHLKGPHVLSTLFTFFFYILHRDVFLPLRGVMFESKWHQSKSYNISVKASSETDKLTHKRITRNIRWRSKEFRMVICTPWHKRLKQRLFEWYFMLCALAAPNMMVYGTDY